MIDTSREDGEQYSSRYKRITGDFRSWHNWENEKSVYREIYTRSISGLVVAIIGYFFVALGTSLRFEPLSYIAWTVVGISCAIVLYTLVAKAIRLMRDAIGRRKLGETAWLSDWQELSRDEQLKLVEEELRNPHRRRYNQEMRNAARRSERATIVRGMIGVFGGVAMGIVVNLASQWRIAP
ncbi:hypothetical protein [Paenarthrobacter nitroguajacolicus]|uniref:hypothetical protein n=1 Tax=Paenarthrobacter nitroguajacolicus TaxID=211146 RepID=UPI00248C4A64|nr:hypothetical protein [Paenarthrobacter nitroguajacolicus]MDI2036821.1 hypothetical protein [Paenarthrobacter nitroguajacolicus]